MNQTVSSLKTKHIYQILKQFYAIKNRRKSPPIIQLNSNEKIILKFDDLNADRKNYKYSIFHCNSNWEKSNLVHKNIIQVLNMKM